MKRLATCAILAGTLAACADKTPDFYSGYVEADYVRLASPIAGTLSQLYVKRGDKVARDAPAFALEQDKELAERREAQSHLAHARATLADLSKGRRPDEVSAAQAQLVQAQAALTQSQADLARQSKLLAAHFIAPSAIDQARAAALRDQGRVHELQAQLRLTHLGARTDELAAAGQDIKAAQAQVAQADWRLAQKSVRVPLDAEVADVLYRAGELVPAGLPVVSLLAPENVRARFFVPQSALGLLTLGQAVNLSCDGCRNPIPATVSFIAHEAEYTAPLIYSKENRANLVFLVEARPAIESARSLHPGQPLEVRLAPAAAR